MTRVLIGLLASRLVVAGRPTLPWPVVVPRAEVRRQVDALRARLPGTDYQLPTECRAIVARILERTPLRRTPRTKPERANGKRAFAQTCAPCHGGDFELGNKFGYGAATCLRRDVLPPAR